jgi:hypothetical protein
MWKLHVPAFQTHKSYVTYFPAVQHLIFIKTSIFNLTY